MRPGPDADRVVVIAATWAKAHMARTHGHAPKGRRLVAAAPRGHWPATTLAGALTTRGFLAPLAVDRAVNGDIFRAYVERVLVPGLRPGGAAVLDNVSRRERAAVRAAVEGAGCELLLLPPYRPDFGPIADAFSKLRRLLRAAVARPAAGRRRAIGRRLDECHPGECRNDFRHCGHNATPT